MISIAICTHNRSDDVAFCLAALAPQLFRTADELLLVDSCSEPSHVSALRSLASAYGARFIRLATPGLSAARNAALSAARGAWIAYLDDDTLPFPDWLSSLRSAIASAAADLGAIGGLTQPLWPGSSPDSAPSHIGPRWTFYLSCIQETVRGSTRDGAKVCGANLAFHCENLVSVGGFRQDLGRVGNRLIGGEETLVVRLLKERGLDVVYDPSVRVRHRIPSDRLSLDWISRRAYWEGVTETAVARAVGKRFPAHLFMPKLAASALLFRAIYWTTRDPDNLIRSQIAAGALRARLAPTAFTNP